MKHLTLMMTLLTLATPAYAQGKTIIHDKEDAAQDIIDACWTISEDNRASGNTPRMRSGALNTALCMEDAILKLVLNYLNKDDPDILAQYRDNLDNLRSSYGGMIWNLYNNHDGCELMGCGTMYHVFHNGAYANLLEDILKTTVRQIQDYDLQNNLLGTAILIGKKPDTISLPSEKPKSLCIGETCDKFTLREVHGIYAVEGLTQSDSNFIAINGFITLADKYSFTVNGHLNTNHPQDKQDVCNYKGDMSFKLIGDKTWVLNTHDIPCLAGQKKIILGPS